MIKNNTIPSGQISPSLNATIVNNAVITPTAPQKLPNIFLSPPCLKWFDAVNQKNPYSPKMVAKNVDFSPANPNADIIIAVKTCATPPNQNATYDTSFDICP